MQVFLLPGLDGTGILFKPLIKALGNEVNIHPISYLDDLEQSYEKLANEVRKQLPDQDEFILVAESFSGPIGYLIASNAPANLKAVVFLATFLTPPNRFMGLISILPLSLLFKLPIPSCVIKSHLLGKEIEAEVIALFRQSLKKTKSHILAFRVKEMSRLKGANRPIQVPCAYVSARNDKLVSKIHINEFRHVASSLEVFEIDGPHFIVQARPEECAKVVKKYAAI